MTQPHESPVIPKDIVFALKALRDGKANEGQQIAVLNWILFDACAIRNLSYQPGDSVATAFAEGRRFAGLIIAGALQAKPVTATRQRKPRQEAKPE